jgi:hypothetical protein
MARRAQPLFVEQVNAFLAKNRTGRRDAPLPFGGHRRMAPQRPSARTCVVISLMASEQRLWGSINSPTAGRREDRRADEVHELRVEFAKLSVELVKSRTEDLTTLHTNLTAAVKAVTAAYDRAAVERSELTAQKEAQREEVTALRVQGCCAHSRA